MIRKPIALFSMAFVMLFAAVSAAHSQTSSPQFNSIPAIAFDTAGPVIRAHAESEKPFTVAGERAVVLGQQNGVFEAWPLPVKLLSHMTIEAEIEGYTVPIDVNQQAAEIEVRPDRTIITYSHIGFTVRQIMFSPAGTTSSAAGVSSTPGAPSFSSGSAGERVGNIADQPGTGPVVLYEFDCVHPTEFTFRFTPELRWMWPERNEGVPGVEWVAGPLAAPTAKEPGPSGAISGVPLPNHGYYVLHTDYPDLAGAVTVPGAQPGVLAPYQERPQVHPVELRLHIDPARDRGRLFPLLMAVGMNKETATNAALGATLQHLNESIPDLYKAQAESYRKLLANFVSIETPDKTLNEAFQWAVVSIEQLKTKALHNTSGAPGPSHLGTWDPNSKPAGTSDDETALVAGYYASADSARPGFGWFFGRDALYTLFAVNGYGNFALSKSELEFLIHRQRDDGKIMHEWSQTAAFIDWRQFPYMYAAADATPLFILAMADYVRSSGDVAFLTAHRDAIEKAWAFETGHADINGIYDNRQGTGWVESWPGGMPHQEVYLAFLDQQASGAMAQLEDLLHDAAKSQAARTRADAIAKTIQAQFWDKDKNCYAFSRNPDGSLDLTSTVYPALAWWSGKGLAGDNSIPAQTGTCLQQLAAHTLNTDWGLRDVANDEKIYDGMSYHQGSVWPLFTGWAALAEYRGNQPLAGYQLLMENANLTKSQDLGAVTELLSGDYFVPFGRSTSHQLWSSAMVITPTLRGLFGLDIDAQTKTITVNPHLPATWPSAEVKNIQVPGGALGLSFHKEGETLIMFLDQSGVEGWKVHTDWRNARPDKIRPGAFDLPLSPVRVSFLGDRLALPGARTSIARVVHEEWNARSVVLQIEGLAGSSADLLVSQRDGKAPQLQVSGGLSNHAKDGEPGALLASLGLGDPVNPPPFASQLRINFPPGEGWKTITITLTW
jgi:glycogen debranching enzyme